MTTSYLECNWFKHASHRNNGKNSKHLLYVALLLPQTLHCENVEISVSFSPNALSSTSACTQNMETFVSLYFPEKSYAVSCTHFFRSMFLNSRSFFFFYSKAPYLVHLGVTVSEDKFSITFLYLGLKFVLSVGFELYRPFNCLWCFFLHSCELSICLNCQSLLPANFLALVSTIVGCQSFKFSSRLLLS